MKKVLLFVAVVAAASFASCKKDHTCTCTDTTTGGGASSSSSSTITYTKARKGDARAACLSSTSSETVGSTTYTTTRDCSIN
ncbi:MAG: hypothetical protein ACJ77K_08550 [Bacteroidia bacterium]